MKKRWMVILLILVLGIGISKVEAREYDFGDESSMILAAYAQRALEVKDYDACDAYINKCIELYREKALVMQASMKDFAPRYSELDYGALNDVGTCYLIKGEKLMGQGKYKEAKDALNTVIKEFYYAQCWRPDLEIFLKPAEEAKDLLKIIELQEEIGGEGEYDFSDRRSDVLTHYAWRYLDEKDYKGVEIYAKACVVLYEEEALKMQDELFEYPSSGWKARSGYTLNDVGTSCFILGEALMAQGKYKEAKDAYTKLIDKFNFSQCLDPDTRKLWKPAKAAKVRIDKINSEHGGKL